MKKKITDRNRLVKKFLEHRKCEDLIYALGKKKRGRGIYVLYNGNKIYYIGLSKRSLRGRLRQHMVRDKHRGKWDNFSFYQIGRTRYIKDIESLFLRVCFPPGNRIRGRFKKKFDLSKKIIRLTAK